MVAKYWYLLAFLLVVAAVFSVAAPRLFAPKPMSEAEMQAAMQAAQPKDLPADDLARLARVRVHAPAIDT